MAAEINSPLVSCSAIVGWAVEKSRRAGLVLGEIYLSLCLHGSHVTTRSIILGYYSNTDSRRRSKGQSNKLKRLPSIKSVCLMYQQWRHRLCAMLNRRRPAQVGQQKSSAVYWKRRDLRHPMFWPLADLWTIIHLLPTPAKMATVKYDLCCPSQDCMEISHRRVIAWVCRAARHGNVPFHFNRISLVWTSWIVSGSPARCQHY